MKLPNNCKVSSCVFCCTRHSHETRHTHSAHETLDIDFDSDIDMDIDSHLFFVWDVGHDTKYTTLTKGTTHRLGCWIHLLLVVWLVASTLWHGARCASLCSTNISHQHGVRGRVSVLRLARVAGLSRWYVVRWFSGFFLTTISEVLNRKMSVAQPRAPLQRINSGIFSSGQGNFIRSSVFRNANPSNLRGSLLDGNKDHLLNQARSHLAKQELHVESLNKCIGELQRQTEEQKLALQDEFVESRREQVRLQEELSMKEKVLRNTQIRNMQEMGEIKRAQEQRIDEVSVQKLRENHETVQLLTSQLQQMQE